MQVRQDAEATRAATFQQLKDSWVQLNLAEATSVDLAMAFQAAREKGWDDAGVVAQSLITGHFRTLFHNWSNAYYHYQNDNLDENQWGAYVREIDAATSNPLILRVWSDWNHVYDDHFRDLMNGFIADSAPRQP
jgi:hypothetical protein